MTGDCITFTTDDGGQVDFRVIEQTVIGGNSYLLVTAESGEDAGCFLILKENTEETDAGMASFETVEDEQELKAVAGVFNELLDDVDLEV